MHKFPGPFLPPSLIYQKKHAGMDHGLITVGYLFCYVYIAKLSKKPILNPT
jgi:hypothetical protein